MYLLALGLALQMLQYYNKQLKHAGLIYLFTPKTNHLPFIIHTFAKSLLERTAPSQKKTFSLFLR